MKASHSPGKTCWRFIDSVLKDLLIGRDTGWVGPERSKRTEFSVPLAGQLDLIYPTERRRDVR